ncbi:MAG: MAPEG family protein [Deltaproteobacteria bacterium]
MPSTHLPITALFAGVNAVWNIALAANVSRVRGKTTVLLGTGDSKELLIAARRHANNAEYLPLALLLILIAELGGGHATMLYVLGGMLTVGRLVHPFGLSDKPSSPRVIGALLTWLSIILGGGYAISVHLR